MANILKKTATLIAVLLVLLSASAQTRGIRREFTPMSDGGVIISGNPSSMWYSPINPGDTIVLKSSVSRTYFAMDSYNGTPSSPIVIINSGGQALITGLGLASCTYIKVTGTGSADNYGIKVSGNYTGVAFNIEGKSRVIEVERVFVNKTKYGFWIKNEPNSNALGCDPKLQEWVLDSMNVHHSRFEDLESQAFYLGSTDGDNCCRPVTCDGVQYYYKPSRLGNIKIHNNYIDGTGRGGIQLSLAQFGVNEIYNNVVRNAGLQYDMQQGAGIILGGYTKASVYNNDVKNTLLWGIAVLGAGDCVVRDNKIDSVGFLKGVSTTTWSPSIYISPRPTTPLIPLQFSVTGNTIGVQSNSSASVHVEGDAALMGSNNAICGNIFTQNEAWVFVQTNITYSSCPVVLPVTLESFEAVKQGSRVNITWKVSGEMNLTRYDVERSTDGTNFSTIKSVTPNGSDTYTAVDQMPASGKNYYRLKMVNADGSYKYSTIKIVQFGSSKTKSRVAVYEYSGRKVAEEDTYNPDIVVGRLRPGNYIVHIVYSDGTRTVEKIWKL